MQQIITRNTVFFLSDLPQGQKVNKTPRQTNNIAETNGLTNKEAPDAARTVTPKMRKTLFINTDMPRFHGATFLFEKQGEFFEEYYVFAVGSVALCKNCTKCRLNAVGILKQGPDSGE